MCNCHPWPPLPTEAARCAVGNLHSCPWLGAPKIGRPVLTLLRQHLEGQGHERHRPIVPPGERPVPTGLRGQRSSLTKAAGEEGGSSVVQNGKPGSLPGAGRQVGILGRNWACLTSTDSSCFVFKGSAGSMTLSFLHSGRNNGWLRGGGGSDGSCTPCQSQHDGDRYFSVSGKTQKPAQPFLRRAGVRTGEPSGLRLQKSHVGSDSQLPPAF